MVSFSLDLIHLQLSFIKMQTISRLITLLYGCTCRIPANTQARWYLLFLCFWLPLAHAITISIHDLYFSVIHQHNLMCEGGSVYHLLMWVQTPRFKENQCHMMKCSYGISRYFAFEELPHTERVVAIVCLPLSLYTGISPKATSNLTPSHGLHGRDDTGQ